MNEAATQRFCAYYLPGDSRIQSKAVVLLVAGEQPQAMPGMEVVVSAEDFDIFNSHIENGMLVSGALPESEVTAQIKKHYARARRDQELERTDWIEGPAGQRQSEDKRNLVLAYRQRLRDWPASDSFPDMASFPQL
jgi:hypothetical protein